MIINVSRARQAQGCWHKAFNIYHRRLGTPKGLLVHDGSAVHKGIAYGMAKKDWPAACQLAHAELDQQVAKLNLLPEEQFVVPNHHAVVEKMIELYRKNYESESYTLLRPECEFEVELPGTEHNCVWLHHNNFGRETWGPPEPSAVVRKQICKIHRQPDPSCQCWQPHRLVGKTDGIVMWQGACWLFEHKTTSLAGEQFWFQWRLDKQLTAYIYGISKALGLTPHGVIVNHIRRPSEAQIANWNSKRKHGEPKGAADYLEFEREAFLREPADLARFEQEITWLCDEWEQRIVQGRFPLSDDGNTCRRYNRICEFFECCVGHDSPELFEGFAAKEQDYVEEKMAKLVQIKETTL